MNALQIGMAIFTIMVVLAGIAGVCASPSPFTQPERRSMSNIKAVLGIILFIIIAALAIIGLSFGGSGLNYWLNKTFMPLNEQVRHETFECSASHSDGIAREIRQYQDQYATADAGGRIIIRQRVLQDYEAQTGTDCPLPQDVQNFANSIR
jgi:hypothetical protein